MYQKSKGYDEFIICLIRRREVHKFGERGKVKISQPFQNWFVKTNIFFRKLNSLLLNLFSFHTMRMKWLGIGVFKYKVESCLAFIQIWSFYIHFSFQGQKSNPEPPSVVISFPRYGSCSLVFISLTLSTSYFKPVSQWCTNMYDAAEANDCEWARRNLI